MEEKVQTELITFPDNQLAMRLFGECDAHLHLLEEQLCVTLHPRGNSVAITARQGRVEVVRDLLHRLYALLEQGEVVDPQRVADGARALLEDVSPTRLFSPDVAVHTPRRLIHPRNARQAAYIETLWHTDLTFATGPAGTGKTYVAVAVAVQACLEGRVARIVLTRPAVEAGERLGFLPGDLQAKVDPYLRPLYDALHDMLGYEKVEKMLDQNLLEIAPLAYMRGRTLEEAFIILDEAQNTTPEQMKMFLTRLGQTSRAVVCGDATQVDLPAGRGSGLVHAMKILSHVDGIGMIHFTDRDVVRHPLVRRIVRAYEEADGQRS
ncbi:MAG: PhoH family protein [Magnetococcales bacterium]|nr:PhoH family protein [Magnetococcales bacterium]MBF0323019.1 PhoH family protein [Magnetococcales bacterium]